MARNFLSKYDPDNFDQDGRLRCLVRLKYVSNTPEEQVRQRLLNWLINKKKWPNQKIKVEKSHNIIDGKGHERIRTDIEIFKGKAKLVIECKREERVLDGSIRQACYYADTIDAKNIWLTNGTDHLFLRKSRKRGWVNSEKLGILEIKYPQRPKFPEFPSKLSGMSIDDYLFKRKVIGDTDFRKKSPYIEDTVMALHNLIFNLKYKLPYSDFDTGIKINEVFDPMKKQFVNQTGSSWSGYYRGFEIVDAKGRKEIFWIGINFGYYFKFDDPKGLYILVGNETRRDAHHRLQLQLNKDNCKFDDSKYIWKLSHHGKMAPSGEIGFSRLEVMNAIRKSNAEHLIDNTSGKERVKLGILRHPDNCTWQNSKKLIANLLEYSLIRQNLRISKIKKHKKKSVK